MGACCGSDGADVDPDSDPDNADYSDADDDPGGNGGSGRLSNVMGAAALAAELRAGRAEVHNVTGEGFEGMSDSVSVMARQNR